MGATHAGIQKQDPNKVRVHLFELGRGNGSGELLGSPEQKWGVTGEWSDSR